MKQETGQHDVPVMRRLFEITEPEYKRRTDHPRVDVDLGRLVIVVNGQYPYEIDLEECTTPAHLLDYVLQVSDKPWCDRELAGELLAAIETVCLEYFDENAQGVFCPFGTSMKVDWNSKESSPESK